MTLEEKAPSFELILLRLVLRERVLAVALSPQEAGSWSNLSLFLRACRSMIALLILASHAHLNISSDRD